MLFSTIPIYICPFLIQRIFHSLVFTSDGECIKSFGSKGNGPGQLSGPRGMCVDRNYVYAHVHVIHYTCMLCD